MLSLFITVIQFHLGQVPGDEGGFYRKDGLFFSVSNVVGGLQTGNILLLKRPLIKNGNPNEENKQHIGLILSGLKSAMVLQLKQNLSKFVMTTRVIWLRLLCMLQLTSTS